LKKYTPRGSIRDSEFKISTAHGQNALFEHCHASGFMETYLDILFNRKMNLNSVA
jgi:hypothetical protein